MVDLHADTTRKDVRALVTALNGAVGVTVVRALTGSKDRATPVNWAKPGGTKPRTKAETQLRLAYRVWMYLEQNEGRSVALAWMMGSNPMLDERTPVTAIRELDSAPVMRAVTAFVDGAAVA